MALQLRFEQTTADKAKLVIQHNEKILQIEQKYPYFYGKNNFSDKIGKIEHYCQRRGDNTY